MNPYIYAPSAHRSGFAGQVGDISTTQHVPAHRILGVPERIRSRLALRDAEEQRTSEWMDTTVEERDEGSKRQD